MALCVMGERKLPYTLSPSARRQPLLFPGTGAKRLTGQLSDTGEYGEEPVEAASYHPGRKESWKVFRDDELLQDGNAVHPNW